MSHHSPLSLQTAASELLSWLNSVDVKEEKRQTYSNSVKAIRAEIRVQPGRNAALAWLRAQPHAQKLYFRSRDESFEVAAVSFSFLASGQNLTRQQQLHLVSILDNKHPHMKFYGASRFDCSPDCSIDPEWELYRGYTFVLPAVELYCDENNFHYLAVNCYPPSGISAARDALLRLAPFPIFAQTVRHSALISKAICVVNTPEFDEWDASMTKILAHLSSDQYQKIVLAHQKKFIFEKNAIPDPIRVLAALDEKNKRKTSVITPQTSDRSASEVAMEQQSNHEQFSMPTCSIGRSKGSQDVQRSYLFCLQLDVGKAFVGCTPEMLFRLEDRKIEAEALAGTVRRGSDEKEAEEMTKLLSKKNMEEHLFVVDHVTKALSECSVHTYTNGPYVRKFARLMHLATRIDGHFRSSELNPASNTFRVLQSMHPTPAVCGMPREETRVEIRRLEGFDRGLFAGPFGWFSTKSAEFCVAIRSAVFHNDELTAFAGSGIVAGSESKSEWDETELKMSAFTEMLSVNFDQAHSLNSMNMKKEQVNNAIGTGVQGCFESILKTDLIFPSVLSMTPGSQKTSIFLSDAGKRKLREVRKGIFLKSPISLSPNNACNCLQKYSFSSFLYNLPNLNSLWAYCCIEELCRNRVDTFFVAPGSRSAPLAVAVVKCRHARYFVTHDERSACFLAVGYARATGRAAAVITTSGTAVANLLPGAVEAYAESLPLILLSADRPPELQNIGANQAITQHEIFGSYVLWSTNLPCPTEAVPLKYLLKTVDHSVRMSGSTNLLGYGRGGPVHINMMFRENLAPDDQPWDRKYVLTASKRWRQTLSPGMLYEKRQLFSLSPSPSYPSKDDLHRQYSPLLREIIKEQDGIIIAGGGFGSLRTEDEVMAFREIVNLLRWPVVSDICGGVRLDGSFPYAIHNADLVMAPMSRKAGVSFRVVLQFGERLTSKKLGKFIQHCAERHEDEFFMHALVSSSTKCSDPLLTITHRVESNVHVFLTMLQAQSTDFHRQQVDVSLLRSKKPRCRNDSNPFPTHMETLLRSSANVDMFLNATLAASKDDLLTEPWCARVITENIPIPSALFIGNSMPIRDFDAFSVSRSQGFRIRVAANRGASGIDGILSSGIGFGIGSDMNVTIIIGDMSLLHDLNTLHFLRQEDNSIPIRVTIVVINNGGGGIFSMLPIARHRNVFSPVFNSPHNINFSSACAMFGIEYVAVKTSAELQTAISRSPERHTLIEAHVVRDHTDNAVFHERLLKLIDEQVSRASS